MDNGHFYDPTTNKEFVYLHGCSIFLIIMYELSFYLVCNIVNIFT